MIGQPSIVMTDNYGVPQAPYYFQYSNEYGHIIILLLFKKKKSPQFYLITVWSVVISFQGICNKECSGMDTQRTSISSLQLMLLMKTFILCMCNQVFCNMSLAHVLLILWF